MASKNTPATHSESVQKEQNDSSDKCMFCKIVNGEMDTELLHCDEDTSCFRDIKPQAPHHYLVVPTKHLGTCESLRKEHIPLVEKLVETGKAILQKNNVTDLSDVRLGFHWPPFYSVEHLHLHVLAPVSEMGFFSGVKYCLDSYWFITSLQCIGVRKIDSKLNITDALLKHHVCCNHCNQWNWLSLKTQRSADQLLQRLNSMDE